LYITKIAKLDWYTYTPCTVSRPESNWSLLEYIKAKDKKTLLGYLRLAKGAFTGGVEEDYYAGSAYMHFRNAWEMWKTSKIR